MRILITGIAGFIGFHLAKRLMEHHDVHGIDNVNDVVYHPYVKYLRLHQCKPSVTFAHVESTALRGEYDLIVHLAAHTAVRQSLLIPHEYERNNIESTRAVIEFASRTDTPVLYASTSCVMAGTPLPWSEANLNLHSIKNPYGYTKAINEVQFRTSRLSTHLGVRFFTVYGPYGRPDMALMGLIKAYITGTPFFLYGEGKLRRDFTHVDDVVDALCILIEHLEKTKTFPFNRDVLNIGRGEPHTVLSYARAIRRSVAKHFGSVHDDAIHKVNMTNSADSDATHADITRMSSLNWKPKRSIDTGIDDIILWLREMPSHDLMTFLDTVVTR